MKLLVQSDDYGISKAVSLGIIEAVKNGILRNTGIFMNMPWTLECAEWIKPYLNDIALGVDANISAGAPLLPASEIPSLCQADGSFLTRPMHQALDDKAENHDHLDYNDVFKELCAHVERFIEVFGKKPDYIQNHAYMTPSKDRAISDVAKKYDIPYCHEAVEKYVQVPYRQGQCSGWYNHVESLDAQINSDLKGVILEDRCHILDHEYFWLICHCGYVDKAIDDLSTYTLFRCADLAAITSNEVKQWVVDNNVELITYKELSR